MRGPDWAWGDQDGGEGCVGTVAKMKNSEDGGKAVVVQWDAGNRCNYSCGIKEKYDLRVYDSAQIGKISLMDRSFMSIRVTTSLLATTTQ